MVTVLPILSPMDRGEIELSLSRQVDRDYIETKAKWIKAEYSEDQQADAVASVHNSIPSRAQIFEIKLAQEAVGFVQVSTHKEQARFIFALERDLWGTDFEKLLLTSFCSQLSKNAKNARVRTFSSAHMKASKSALESLGLDWEEAPWERWIHVLYEENDEKSPVKGDPEVGEPPTSETQV